MLLASRVTNRGDLRGGCIALCKSEDLINWTYEKPFYDPKMYITMECPELFKMGEYWYLVFSTFSDQFTTHYRISKTGMAHGKYLMMMFLIQELIMQSRLLLMVKDDLLSDG